MCLRGRANADADILERVPRVEEDMNKDIARWGQQYEENHKCKWTRGWMCNEFNTGCLPLFSIMAAWRNYNDDPRHSCIYSHNTATSWLAHSLSLTLTQSKVTIDVTHELFYP